MNLLDQIKDAGIIGMGGAGFPTHAKLTSEAEYILLNGAECEPLLRVDQQLMAIYPDEIIKGLVEAGRHERQKSYHRHKEEARRSDRAAAEQDDALGLSQQAEVKLLPDIYPAGDEQVLVYQLTGRIVPGNGHPYNGRMCRDKFGDGSQHIPGFSGASCHGKIYHGGRRCS